MTVTLDDLKYVANEYLLPFGFKVLIACAIFVIGRWVSRAVLIAFDRVMERSKVDVSLRKFLGDIAYAVLFVIIVIASLDTIGVKTTAVVAVLGAAGLAVGLALQGSLSNFAAGVMLIVLRPYKVNDVVVIGTYFGRVDAIRVFHTILITADNREVTIPNGQIIAAPIENMTVLGHRRVDLVVNVALGADLHAVRELLAGVLRGDARVQQDPAPEIYVAEIADTGIKLNLRPWTAVNDYVKLTADLMERIKTAMEAANQKYGVTLQAPGRVMQRVLVAAGAINAAIAVAAGAFAAHALRERLDARALEVFETGARYHMFHALAMIACGVVAARTPGWLFQVGIVLFSGSLYALALSGTKALGAITPLGGVAFLVAWVWLAVATLRGA